MQKVRTKNKWDEITPLQAKIGNILKVAAIVTFLGIWIPAMVLVINEFIKFFII